MFAARPSLRQWRSAAPNKWPARVRAEQSARWSLRPINRARLNAKEAKDFPLLLSLMPIVVVIIIIIIIPDVQWLAGKEEAIHLNSKAARRRRRRRNHRHFSAAARRLAAAGARSQFQRRRQQAERQRRHLDSRPRGAARDSVWHLLTVMITVVVRPIADRKASRSGSVRAPPPT